MWEMWKCENERIWEFGNVGMWECEKCGNVEMWK